jgi:hypothetical protein
VAASCEQINGLSDSIRDGFFYSVPEEAVACQEGSPEQDSNNASGLYSGGKVKPVGEPGYFVAS